MTDLTDIEVGDVWRDCTSGSCRHVRVVLSKSGRVEAEASTGTLYGGTEDEFRRRYKFAYAATLVEELRVNGL